MNPSFFRHARAGVVRFAVSIGLVVPLVAAPIPGLFGTGLDESGALLGPGETDPHYVLVESADDVALGPEAYTLVPGFPVGPWVEEGPDSRWIAPQADQSTGNLPGNYTYRTTFDLTGLDPGTASIEGSLGTDNGLTGVRLNGSPLSGIVSAGFGALTDFVIPVGSPFVDGVNTLEFDVNNAGDDANPTGFRVRMIGRATGQGEAPTILAEPRGRSVLVGDNVILAVEAAGSAPLAFRWLFNGDPIPGATGPSLVLTGLAPDDSGSYRVGVTNEFGGTVSAEAIVVVLVPFPGIYDTGVDAERVPLADGEVDPHYRLTLNADVPGATEAYAQVSIPAPPWIANGEKSRWIGPAPEPAALAGDYTYRLELDLTGYDATTAFLDGDWATDDAGALFLNGADTGFRSLGFSVFSSFSLTDGFVSGINVLEFRVNNGGANPTGLRVENLRGTAEPGTTVPGAPVIVTQPMPARRVLTESVVFTVVADGLVPFQYQWFRDGDKLDGETDNTLFLPFVTNADAGSYTVRVGNTLGTTNSRPAQLEVHVPRIGVFNTGVDSSGAVLPAGQPDPHYVLVASADPAYPGPGTLVTAGPMPPWFANDDDSAWIGPRGDAADAAPGVYRYRLIFPIDDPDEVDFAELLANVGTDDGNNGVFLNGSQVEFSSGTGFGTLTPLYIPSGSPFRAGLNTLDFVVNNGGAAANPTGLRVDDIELLGVTPPPPSAELAAERVGASVRLSWSAAANGFVLEEAEVVSGAWADSDATIAVEGDRNVAEIDPSGPARYFRLRR